MENALAPESLHILIKLAHKIPKVGQLCIVIDKIGTLSVGMSLWFPLHLCLSVIPVSLSVFVCLCLYVCPLLHVVPHTLFPRFMVVTLDIHT